MATRAMQCAPEASRHARREFPAELSFIPTRCRTRAGTLEASCSLEGLQNFPLDRLACELRFGALTELTLRAGDQFWRVGASLLLHSGPFSLLLSVFMLIVHSPFRKKPHCLLGSNRSDFLDGVERF